MQKLLILVGLPGCGKSTYAQRLPGVVHSTDAIREELTGEAGDNTQNERVFKVFGEENFQGLTLPVEAGTLLL